MVSITNLMPLTCSVLRVMPCRPMMIMAMMTTTMITMTTMMIMMTTILMMIPLRVTPSQPTQDDVRWRYDVERWLQNVRPNINDNYQRQKIKEITKAKTGREWSNLFWGWLTFGVFSKLRNWCSKSTGGTDARRHRGTWEEEDGGAQRGALYTMCTTHAGIIELIEKTNTRQTQRQRQRQRGEVYICKNNHRQWQTRVTRFKGKVTSTKQPDIFATNSVRTLKDVRLIMDRQVPLWKAFCLPDSKTGRRSWISQCRWLVVMG